jgi:hypothetical protein
MCEILRAVTGGLQPSISRKSAQHRNQTWNDGRGSIWTPDSARIYVWLVLLDARSKMYTSNGAWNFLLSCSHLPNIRMWHHVSNKRWSKLAAELLVTSIESCETTSG